MGHHIWHEVNFLKGWIYDMEFWIAPAILTNMCYTHKHEHTYIQTQNFMLQYETLSIYLFEVNGKLVRSVCTLGLYT